MTDLEHFLGALVLGAMAVLGLPAVLLVAWAVASIV